MSQLIDTTEMYLKTVYELYEEDIPALRARIVERLEQSGPTVSETVSRMERDGLLHVGSNRHIEFTAEGLQQALHVMRRHRLVERLLSDVIKLDWPQLHDEACRWEHVVSEDVADKIAQLLDDPHSDPYGNPIPDREAQEIYTVSQDGVTALSTLEESAHGRIYTIARIAESVQLDVDILEMLYDEGVLPGADIVVNEVRDGDVLVSCGEHAVRLSGDVARGIFIRER
ncbi:metal-dependent transcriptional regulator [Trueperella sp. LYQ143]|uniref:metal-dependent transcriptional regulator n=1 Tax=unclassified Trueperella TaxID=2630174 RepID=UPI003982E24B